MPDTTYEQAKRCPRCGEPGEEQSVVNKGNDGKVHTFRCLNERCRWFETNWIVQVRPDGTIPQRKPGEKDYDVETGRRMETYGRHEMEEILQAKASKDGEIRNPFG